MGQASTFTPLPAPADAPAGRWQAAALGALEGAAFTIPVSLGSVTLVFSRIGPQALGAAVLATLLALAVLQIATIRMRRPQLYCARIFEATTLAFMLDQMGGQLARWSLPDTQGVRLALLCLTVAAAGLFVGLLYLARADRFTRFIPQPVFAGFANGIALVLLASQVQSLSGMLVPGSVAAITSIAAVSLATGLAVRRWLPRWPAGASALAAGFALGLVWFATGQTVPMLGAAGFDLRLPVMLADFGALGAPGVDLGGLAVALGTGAAILGSTIFVNTTMTGQVLSHADGRAQDGRPALAWKALCLAMVGMAGSAPLSGSMQSSVNATRNVPIGQAMIAWTAVILGVIGLCGIVDWLPLAAVAGALLCEAWLMVDRGSVRNLLLWLRRQPLGAHNREDLALVAAVTGVAVFVNMVAAVFAGWLLGLMLFAARSARRPVRNVWSGQQLSSNCARQRSDVNLLARHGDRLRVVEFERDLFFGAVESLELVLQKQLHEADCVVLDWSMVRHVDSSAARAVDKFARAAAARRIPVFHVEPAGQPDVHAALAQYADARTTVGDLDQALERAESHLLALHGVHREGEGTTLLDTASLMQGLDDAERALLEAAMQQRMVARGQPIMRAGDPGGELLLVLQGSANVMLPAADGAMLRVAGVRRGATIGEMGFLDGSARSATVLADDDVLLAVLTRQAFDALGAEHPLIARRVVTNIALDMATRLRRSNVLASARHARR